MYINQIEIENFRTFRKQKEPIRFVHPDRDWNALGMPKPQLMNVNLLLGNNGSGKTSLLKAIALAALGPAAPRSDIPAYRWVRREPGVKAVNPASLKASFLVHAQDHTPAGVAQVESDLEIRMEGDYELLEWKLGAPGAWQPVFSSDSDAFFMVGYGATRRMDKSNKGEPPGKLRPRTRRVMSLFEEDYALRPLNSWLLEYRESSQLRGRYVQVLHLMNRLLGKGHLVFSGEQDGEGEFLFEQKGLKVPFPALSDGYRAYLGWVADLLYHVCHTCPSGKKLVENRGIVMVDEIDLHLHPKWQMTVLPTLAKALPNIQFIITSHSPLVVGSLEWMNIIVMKPGTKGSSRGERLTEAVHGLDADQVLLTDFFGLESTRAGVKETQMKDLTLKARAGDDKAAMQLLNLWSKGLEEVQG